MMRAMTAVESDVIQFVARETSARADRLSLKTDLGQDLGVDGDDGTDLMCRFAARFAVDLADFDAKKYFGPEAGFNPLMLLWPAWWRARRLTSLTIADLVRSAEAKRWAPAT
jgi:hypothetical protein